MKLHLISAILLGVCCPAVVLAQSPAASNSSSNVQRAREHFLKGVALYKDGSLDAAWAEFERAYELAPDSRLLYNLAQVQLERHDYVAAMERFRAYLAQAGSELTQERRAEVESELKRLTGLVAQLAIVVDVQGAELVIDGTRVGTLPTARPVSVNAGAHNVVVRKAGYASAQRELTVTGGETQRLEFTLKRETGSAAVPRAPVRSDLHERTQSSPDRSPMWISLVATAALGTTSVLLALRTGDAKSDFERDLAAFPGDPTRIEDDRSKLKLYAGLTDGFAGATLVAAGFFTYFAISGGSTARSERAGRSIRVLPSLSGLRLVGDL